MQVRSTTRQVRRRRGAANGGFTLVEMLIVIGIMALLTSLVLGTLTRMGASNRRMTCQSNLAQIYQSCRLYQQDEGGFPFFDDAGLNPDNTAGRGIGLWALYAFPKAASSDSPDPNRPLGRYLHSSRVLHCPQDTDSANQTLLNGAIFNNGYLSYQKVDPDGIRQYQSIRTTTAGADWKRQLIAFSGTSRVYRAPADDTVVTWCPFHRQAVGGRNFDNVLFYDGSVQLIQRQPDDGSIGWQRKPKGPV